MKTRFTGCFLIAALLAGGPGCKTMTPPPPAKPTAGQGGAEIRFAETEHDFGEVANGASLKYDFVFTNTGTCTLEITDVSPECSCATTGNWSRKVEPGRSGTIPIRFNSTTLSGPIFKRVGITSNSPTLALTVLHLKANVWKAIDVDPATVSFTPQDEVKTMQTKVVRIVNHTKVPLELSPPECQNPAFTAELRTLRAGREYEAILQHHLGFSRRFQKRPRPACGVEREDQPSAIPPRPGAHHPGTVTHFPSIASTFHPTHTIL